MTREKMTEMLSETISVTREEAQAALEAREWNILDAGQLLLERARAGKAEAAADDRPAGLMQFVRATRSRIARDRAEARGDDAAGMEMTAAVLAPLMLMPAVYACR